MWRVSCVLSVCSVGGMYVGCEVRTYVRTHRVDACVCVCISVVLGKHN